LKESKSIAKETKDKWWNEAINYTNKETFVANFKHHVLHEYILNHSNILSFIQEAFIITELVYILFIIIGSWSVHQEINY